jgi:predicted ATP-grasp superfamily ATP-dependent carboligase
VNILISSSRAPVTLELIRAFGRAGHAVYAADTQPWTLGSHSRYLRRHIVTPSPRHDPHGFITALEDVIGAARIDWLIPTCEEVFWIARFHARLAEQTRVYTSPLEQLAELHHKYRFQQRAAALGLRTPETMLLRSACDLRAALRRFPAYLLRPVYSRFATRIVTNCGPRADRLPLTACQPSPDQPWLAQEYIAGETVCTYSTLHRGRVTAHCAYATPYKVNHGSGVQFVTIDGAPTLALVQRLGAALGYTGQLALDLLQSADGLYLLECNPRATSGVHLLSADQLIGGLTDPNQPTAVAPPGRSGQLAIPLLTSVLREPQRWPAALQALRRHGDVIIDRADPLPALIQLRMALHIIRLSVAHRRSLTAATTYDIEWNGE